MPSRVRRSPALAAALATAGGCAAVLLTVAPAAGSTAATSAGTSYWTIYNPPGKGRALCLTAGTVGGSATVDTCDGSPAQDWAFVRGGGGEYLTNRAVRGSVLGVRATAGSRAVLMRLDRADPRQVFVAGDPLAANRNQIRPRSAPGLCLTAQPARTARAPVVLRACGTDANGPQAWITRFNGNH